jgi:hypothetical protein
MTDVYDDWEDFHAWAGGEVGHEAQPIDTDLFGPPSPDRDRSSRSG